MQIDVSSLSDTELIDRLAEAISTQSTVYFGAPVRNGSGVVIARGDAKTEYFCDLRAALAALQVSSSSCMATRGGLTNRPAFLQPEVR